MQLYSRFLVWATLSVRVGSDPLFLLKHQAWYKRVVAQAWLLRFISISAFRQMFCDVGEAGLVAALKMSQVSIPQCPQSACRLPWARCPQPLTAKDIDLNTCCFRTMHRPKEEMAGNLMGEKTFQGSVPPFEIDPMQFPTVWHQWGNVRPEPPRSPSTAKEAEL